MNIDDLKRRKIDGEDSITTVLDELARHPVSDTPVPMNERLARGIAFCTFAFDIDGVSMEIAKYARCFETISPGVPVHCIGGTFADKADVVLDPTWRRFRLLGADGWDKWDGGRWFAALFYKDLPQDSAISSSLACEIWRQAIELAEQLVVYIEEHDIGVLFPVNTNSNPGNLAFALGDRPGVRSDQHPGDQQQPRLLLGGRQGGVQEESRRATGTARPLLPQPRQRGVLRPVPAHLSVEWKALGPGQHQPRPDPQADRPLPLPTRRRLHDRNRVVAGVLPSLYTVTEAGVPTSYGDDSGR